MAKDFDSMEDSNRSANLPWQGVSDPARRVWLQGGLGAALAAGLSGCATAGSAGPKPGFTAVPTSRADTVVAPAGYTAQAIAPWGDPVGIPGAMPAWRPDASISAADQAVQLGRHHDGMHFHPLADGAGATRPRSATVVIRKVDGGVIGTSAAHARHMRGT